MPPPKAWSDHPLVLELGRDRMNEMVLLADMVAERIAARFDTPGGWLTTAQACEHLQVSRPTLERLARRGEVERRKVGSLNRYARESLDRYVRGGGHDAGPA